MHGIILGDLKENRREMLNLLGDPVKRGWEYLRAHAGKHVSELDAKPGVTFTDNFTQLLILEATGDRSLVTLTAPTEPSRHWNYFQGKGLLTYEKFPDDLDTTSLGLVTMKPPKELVHSIMDEMLNCLNPDGLPYSYFDPQIPRLDPALSVNVLHLFYTHGRGHELPSALEWVHSVLKNRAYLRMKVGCRGYTTAMAIKAIEDLDSLRAKDSSR
ncbi:hypothetical protein L227DRAFT_397698 [Lentinus tigrinus ALCF2SS1-6]|uniref:Uncharacterized protein n=1 Tax=Lentinus tigrinus ALCF2SS1-6 TaxID=1328759 RepID=A0A5C2RQT5_9APHY|nr:hypothetical protein L227DRAFT_397698 [Lentinus tigrinus ALCF2SS1-6]